VKNVGNVDLFIHDSLHTFKNTLFEMEQAASVMPPGGVMLIDDIRSHDGFLTFAKRHPEFKTILVSTLDGIGAVGIAVSGPGRELCAPASVIIDGKGTEPVVRRGTRVVITSPPVGGSGTRETLALAGCVDPRRSASRPGAPGNRPSARVVPRAVGGPERHAAAAHRVPAFHRRSFWLEQASASGALAETSRRSSDTPVAAVTSSRRFQGPPVRSRRPPRTAA
jgi:hypothetical protein